MDWKKIELKLPLASLFAVPLTEEEESVSSAETKEQIAASVTNANKDFETLILVKELKKKVWLSKWHFCLHFFALR
jgi:hypothetical protein